MARPLNMFRIELGRIGRIGNRRIVDQHQDRFALDIDTLVIIPAVLRRDDAVTDKDDLRIFRLDFPLQPGGGGDVVVREFQRRWFCRRR